LILGNEFYTHVVKNIPRSNAGGSLFAAKFLIDKLHLW